MTAERRKVLDMLAAGRITPEDAEKLLDRLASPGAPEAAAEGAAAGVGGGESGRHRRGLRFLRIVVDSPKRDNVNIRVPLGLVRTGLKLSTLMPGKVSRRLSERGIDLSHLGKLDDEALTAELSALHVDVSAEDGEKVRIFCE